jgi:glycosyltransferase involved in cell wall biosynthesis
LTLKRREIEAVAALYRLMRAERPHIVHTHTAKAGFVGRLAARMAGVPIVVHTYHGHVLRGYYPALQTRLLRVMERALATVSDRLVAVSKGVKQDLVDYGVARPEKISVIPLGFDLKPFVDAHPNGGGLRRELGLADPVRLVGIIGRIFPIKNHRLFLNAAARVARVDADTRFVVVGDGTLRPAMEAHARALGLGDRVVFTGWRRDLARIYPALDALVVSSDNEGTPVSAVEAMASGCPVVATHVGGLPDLIEDGRTGRLVPPGDPESLASAILDVLGDAEGRRRMGRAARESAAARFGLDRLLNDVERLYDELLAGKGIRPRATAEAVV